ncbi:MAG: SsrA-binding protein SmpB [Elusimicrobiaceae bacterium]|jgi:SsrA-binding protein|nr:SsrA-binding protein SmpB [Elusimicrobiaceae bacterium]MBT3954601.1 SsrA-binding protein SmpB [Elusimicrobiaceae bacterium]MBT4007909.1 SsrA-binding protein SmpB [Elusimicrobiaceae bacterium]MBT4403118.1 SsrA-binding protein SmpB [Elusimicrobiaceae bacterium]MBT4439923.1 SsrA-binding protein SmpB [Elusimicrobiaceae bacterium]
MSKKIGKKIGKKPDNNIIKNKKAFFDYEILETFEAGVELSGAEVKSVKAKEVSLEGAFVKIEDNMQAFIHNMSITPYENAHIKEVDPTKTRKLLLHKKEIKKLLGLQKLKNQTIIPLGLYLKKGWIKMSIGLVKGKKQHDKRDSIKKKDLSRDMDRQFKGKIKL